MKILLKAASAIALIIGLSVVNIAQSVNALGVGSTFVDTIPDQVTRNAVIAGLAFADPNATENTVITQAHIDGLNAIMIMDPAQSQSLAGLEYFVELSVIDVMNDPATPGGVTEIPESFSALTKIMDINISGNMLESLPANFTQFTSLTKVTLFSNRLHNVTPAQYAFVEARNGAGVGTTLANQVYERALGNTAQSQDFVYPELAIYTQATQFGAGVTITYQLMKPDGNEAPFTPAIANGQVTIPASELTQLGDYMLTATITGGLMDGSTYTDNFTVVEPGAIVNPPGTPGAGAPGTPGNTGKLPNTGTSEAFAYIGLLSAATLFITRKSI